MGKLYANMILAGRWQYSHVAARWLPDTDAALQEKVAAGVLTEERLAELMEL